MSKKSSSVHQILIKIKHKVKWMVKFVKSTSPSSHVHSLVSTTKHLGKIKLHMVFSLKKFFEQTKVKKISNLFHTHFCHK